jgi:histone H3/H4
VTRAIARVTDVDVQDKKIQRTMEEAVKTAVEQTARDVVKEAVKAVADAG